MGYLSDTLASHSPFDKAIVSREHLRRPELLDAQPCEPLAHVHRGLKRLPEHQPSKEPASERVARAVRVVDLGRVDGVHGNLLDLALALDGDECGLGALGNDDGALALGVLFGEVGEGAGDVLGGVGGEGMRLSVGGSLGLVADDVVGVGGGGVEDVLEELGDEGGGEVDDEGLVLGGGEGAELLDGGRADCREMLVRMTGFICVFALRSSHLDAQDIELGVQNEKGILGKEGGGQRKSLPVQW